jgi:predicted ribosome quality control (RQC) complex YloA/Tae2 family protein
MPEPTCDLLWLTLLARELTDDLTDRLVRIRRHADRPWVWIDGGADRSWLAEMTPGSSRLHRARPAAESAEDWRTWGGRRTDGTTVTNVGVRRGDRVLAMRLAWNSRLGESAETDLLLEFAGRHPNAIIADAQSEVMVDVLRPVSGKMNRFRELLPNRKYIVPPVFDRHDINEPWPWQANEGKTLRGFLKGGLLATSNAWVAELCGRANIPGDTVIEDVSPETQADVEGVARQMLLSTEAYLLLDDTGRPIDHVAFRPTFIEGSSFQKTPDAATAIDDVWSMRSRILEDTRLEREFATYRKRREKELRRRQKHLSSDLLKTDGADELARTADLIMAHMGQFPPRAGEIELTDWYDPDQRTVTVRLDPDREPAEQAEQLYRRSRKLRQSIPHIEARLSKAEHELKMLLDAGDQPTEEMLKDMARKQQHIDSTPESRNDADSIRPRRYRTRDGGWLVLVGRTDRENDTLSIKVAAGDDLWFHAHGVPGSHVLMRREGRPENPSRQAIGETAAVAAYWSKARGAQKVGVSYTEAKYVRKPKGSPAGTVTIRHEKLVTVPPALLPLDDDVKHSPPGED